VSVMIWACMAPDNADSNRAAVIIGKHLLFFIFYITWPVQPYMMRL